MEIRKQIHSELNKITLLFHYYVNLIFILNEGRRNIIYQATTAFAG